MTGLSLAARCRTAIGDWAGQRMHRETAACGKCALALGRFDCG